MNLHVPQSIVTENELRSIAAVPFQIMSPKECKPLIAVVQDVALGIYRLTKKHTLLSEKNFFNLLSTNSKFYGNVPRPALTNGDIQRWSGKQALSAIIPNKVNLKSANNSYDEKIDDKDNFVIIENGEILQGTIDKKIYQNRTKGLIHSIFNDCNEEETRHFFDNTQRLICNWLVQSGFSVGISDLIVDDDTQHNLKKVINDMKVQVYDIIKDIHMNKFENLTINNNHDYFESEINKILNKAREQTGKLGLSKINDLENRMINMIKSGSKGSVINVAQMIACVGQQNVDGKRIAYGFDNRTLPHYVKYDDGPDSRGFVENSFISGLSPQEFFFHSMGGREGLIDTAVKTSETGYLQRKLVKAMEDCKITYDYTVRNASGSIIQFLYGEDGMDPIKIESQSLPYIDMDFQKLQSEYLLTKHDDFQYLLDERVFRDLKGDWDAPFKKLFDQIVADREFMIAKVFKKKHENTFMYPVSFTRIINNAKAMMQRYGMKILSDLSPVYVLDTINKLCEELFINPNNRGDMFIKMMVRCHLSPKQVIFNYKFNKDVFDYVVQQVKHRFFDAIAHPSEMVGVVAAQSIGEPCTQLTLNSVEWNTELLLDVDGKLERVKIGQLIDSTVDSCSPDKMENHPNDTKLVWIKEKNIKVLSCDESGKMSWQLVEAVTKHPPINKDGSSTLLQVNLQSGRSVIATKAKSFLKRQNNKIVEINGDELKEGDYIPVSMVLPITSGMESVDVSQYLPKSEIEKEYQNTATSIPEKIPMDALFGFLVGAYASDGYCTPSDVVISSVHDDKINAFCKSYSIGCDIDEQGSKTLRLHSTVLSSLMEAIVGSGAENKRLPGWVLQAPIEFLRGIIDAFFSSNGSITKDDRDCISATSVSRGLLDDIQQVLLRFEIVSSIGVHDTPFSYKLSISCANMVRFANTFKLEIDTKIFTSSESDVIPDVVTEKFGPLSLHRDQVPVLLQDSTLSPSDRAILNSVLQENVIYDKVVSIREVTSEYPYVYDLTVQNTKNFNTFTGIAMRDTFHHSGISSASKAVRGVPRIKELLSVTKNIKAPSMTVHLKEDFNKDKMKANEVLKSIQTTFFKDIVKSSKIYYDANDFTTDIEDDPTFVNSYKELMELDLVKSYDTAPWLLRFEINRDKLLEEGISMITLYNILQDYYEETISCMFSDDNSNNLIFRIKLLEDSGDEERDYITELKALEKNIMENILIKGTKNVKKSMMNKQEFSMYNEDTLQFDKTFEWVLDTSGTNLIDVMCHPKVDYTKTVSNDINEIYDVLGIEAARAALYNELSGVIADAELYVNYRHIALLVDTMTNRGYLLSIDRHGINRVDIGPLAKCSFEETTDMLIKAGIFSEVDKITGVSANIMLGQIPPCGTGDTEVLIDEHKLLNLQPNVVKFQEDSGEQEEYADVCTFDNLAFDFRLPAKKDGIEAVKDFDIAIV